MNYTFQYDYDSRGRASSFEYSSYPPNYVNSEYSYDYQSTGIPGYPYAGYYYAAPERGGAVTNAGYPPPPPNEVGPYPPFEPVYSSPPYPTTDLPFTSPTRRDSTAGTVTRHASGKGRNRPKTPPDMCAVCGVTSTNEWRKGPAGSRSLCNACGLNAAKRFKDMPDDVNRPIEDIKRDLRIIGADRFKKSDGEWELPPGTDERLARIKERTNRAKETAMARALANSTGTRPPRATAIPKGDQTSAARALLSLSKSPDQESVLTTETGPIHRRGSASQSRDAAHPYPTRRLTSPKGRGRVNSNGNGPAAGAPAAATTGIVLPPIQTSLPGPDNYPTPYYGPASYDPSLPMPPMPGALSQVPAQVPGPMGIMPARPPSRTSSPFGR